MYSTIRSPLRARLLRWYARTSRDLPWRRTRDPYAILVSEVMLQQTQVARVLPAYPRFLRRFPTVPALARAPLAAVLREWAGLGYNRRALNLHRAAQAAGRRLPRTAAALRELPGIGPYTASAVACFAHHDPEAFADTNIRRVLGRIALGRTADLSEAIALDAALLPRARAAPWHQALMDLGATVCVSRDPHCERCPVAVLCTGRGTRGEVRPATQTPFGPSDRRVRGAIVRVLRDAPAGLGVAALTRAIGDDRVPPLVAALAREGLVSRRGARIVLGA